MLNSQIILEMKKQENTIAKPIERPKPKNEVKAFDRLISNLDNY